MRKIMLSGALFALAALLPLPAAQESAPEPFVPVSYAASATTLPSAESALPTGLIIPAINLNAPVVPVGVNAKGEMDVPSGATRNIGWYSGGTVPGAPGSAVMDAHVFAAFSALHKLRPGDDIYVATAAGTRMRFRITAMKTYPLAQVPLQKLFNGRGGRELNLITCAGTFLPAQHTYSERLIVFATLAD